MESDGKFGAEQLMESSDRGARFTGETLASLGVDAECVCHHCISENKIARPDWPKDTKMLLSSAIMILCPTCGNKRCPKASDHRNECSGSNAPGQKGSVY